MKKQNTAVVLLVLLSVWLSPSPAKAHCDTLDGPVVATARVALKKGDVTPVLKWVKKENENEIRELFKKTVAVRNKGKEAKELADMYFFETLVRIHRAAEGAPYTGLKPAGQVATDTANAGIRNRFNQVQEAKKHAEESVTAGRKYVAAYVDYTHYIENLFNTASSSGDQERMKQVDLRHGPGNHHP